MWPDWTHCNALVYMPDGNLLLSSRHQSWVLKIQYLDGLGNGDVLWRFGPDGDFTLTPNDPTQWFWDQHYPVLLKVDGSKITLGLFDNGNQRPHDGQQCYLTNSCYSRGVIFDLDESTLTADIAWQYKLPFSNLGWQHRYVAQWEHRDRFRLVSTAAIQEWSKSPTSKPEASLENGFR